MELCNWNKLATRLSPLLRQRSEMEVLLRRSESEQAEKAFWCGSNQVPATGMASAKQGLSALLTIGSLMSRPVPGTGCRGYCEYEFERDGTLRLKKHFEA
jgi:hypothetical protein